MKLTKLPCLLAASTVVLSACGGGGGGGSATQSEAPPPLVTFSHVFPQGDARAAKGTAWDIVGVKTTLSGRFGDGAGQLYDTLRVDVTFAQDVSKALPAPGQFLKSGGQLGVTISFDTDADSTTGAYETCNVGSGIHPFDYVVDPGLTYGRLADGNFSIIDGSGGAIYAGTPNPPEEAATAVSRNTVSQTYFLPAISVSAGPSVPHIGLDVAAFDGLHELTDCVPYGNGELSTSHA